MNNQMPLQLVFWAINKHDVWLAGGGGWPKSPCWNITIYKIWHLRQKKTNSKQTYYEDQKVITGHHLQPWVASFMAGHLLTIKREVFLLNLSPWSNLQKQILQFGVICQFEKTCIFWKIWRNTFWNCSLWGKCASSSGRVFHSWHCFQLWQQLEVS